MQDYYDPHPGFLLERSILLAGHPGSGTPAIARDLAARTGLPFTEVERWTEAEAGCSRARILIDTGSDALRDLDARALERALARRPHGFISAESYGLEARECLELAAEACCVLFVSRPPEELLARIRQRLARAPGSLVEFLAGPPDSPAALQAWLERRRHAEAVAHARIDAGSRHASRIADDVLASLERLVGVETMSGMLGLATP